MAHRCRLGQSQAGGQDVGGQTGELCSSAARPPKAGLQEGRARGAGAGEILARLQSLLPFLTPGLVVSEKTERRLFRRLLIYSSFT